jgi:hypothetical protein
MDTGNAWDLLDENVDNESNSHTSESYIESAAEDASILVEEKTPTKEEKQARRSKLVY